MAKASIHAQGVGVGRGEGHLKTIIVGMEDGSGVTTSVSIKRKNL